MPDFVKVEFVGGPADGKRKSFADPPDEYVFGYNDRTPDQIQRRQRGQLVRALYRLCFRSTKYLFVGYL